MIRAGNAIKGKRDQFTLASKFGYVFRNGEVGIDNTPEHIK